MHLALIFSDEEKNALQHKTNCPLHMWRICATSRGQFYKINTDAVTENVTVSL